MAGSQAGILRVAYAKYGNDVEVIRNPITPVIFSPVGNYPSSVTINDVPE